MVTEHYRYKHLLLIIMLTVMTSGASASNPQERFADIQMLRYDLPGFADLTVRQKTYVYYLTEAALWGRDITFDQFGRHNLLIRRTLEAIYTHVAVRPAEFDTYLRQVWFSSGIYHHYSGDKFVPQFTREWFEQAVRAVPASALPMPADALLTTIVPTMFDAAVYPKRVNKAHGDDLIRTSAVTFYQGVSQADAEAYYNDLKAKHPTETPSYGLNTTLTPDGEKTWRIGGMYSATIKHIVDNLRQASSYAENDEQRHVIALLIDYYTTGDVSTFDTYSIAWLRATAGDIDFINGFIETYNDPLGIKASWEAIVEYKDHAASQRTATISASAQWFEDHSPIDPRFRKAQVRGITANVINAAMIAGDLYPSTAIGINLPNADWIRAAHGSKSITIGNFTAAYAEASQHNGFLEEFVPDADMRTAIRQYGRLTDDLHTDLHECLGHGSGKLLPGVSPDSLNAYGATIEEARADLFALYYLADPKLVELALVPAADAYLPQYYSYILNGLLTQCVRIKEGDNIEEAHMRNRALIANWCYRHAEGALALEQHDGKTALVVRDYQALRTLFARLLAEIQRIKSEGDYTAARDLVEQYGVRLDPVLHHEILTRYQALDIAPYKGFINPVLTPQRDAAGNITDVTADVTETYDTQHLRYSRDYSVEP